MLCEIRRWQYDDAAELARHGDDPGVWAQMRDRFPKPYTLDRAKWWIQWCMDKGPTHFAIAVDGRPVGGVGWERDSDVHRVSAEVGYWVGREFWGRGVATRALQLLVEKAREAEGLTRLYAVAFAENLASRRVLEKAGFGLDAMLRRSAVKEGVIRDQALYSRVIG